MPFLPCPMTHTISWLFQKTHVFLISFCQRLPKKDIFSIFKKSVIYAGSLKTSFIHLKPYATQHSFMFTRSYLKNLGRPPTPVEIPAAFRLVLSDLIRRDALVNCYDWLSMSASLFNCSLGYSTCCYPLILSNPIRRDVLVNCYDWLIMSALTISIVRKDSIKFTAHQPPHVCLFCSCISLFFKPCCALRS